MQLQLACGLFEVESRGGLNAVGTTAEIDVIEIKLEDFLFREALLDLLGDPRLEELSTQAFVGGAQPVRENIARQLHGDRAGALIDLARHDVAEGGARDPHPVDAVVLVEALVFNRDECTGDVIGQCAQLHRLTLHRRQVGKLAAVTVQENGCAARLIGNQSRGIGTAAQTTRGVQRIIENEDATDGDGEYLVAPAAIIAEPRNELFGAYPGPVQKVVNSLACSHIGAIRQG
jgi:hypothetical protein